MGEFPVYGVGRYHHRFDREYLLQSPVVHYVTSYIGVLVFVGLTAYDTQKIKQLGQAGFADGESRHKAAIIGALRLYLDFINLFLMLLRVMGNRR